MKKVKEYIKRIGAMGLTAAMLVSQFPTTALAAQEIPEKTIEIKGFDGLPDDVKAQKLPVGSSESDIKLPDTIIKPQSEDKSDSEKTEEMPVEKELPEDKADETLNTEESTGTDNENGTDASATEDTATDNNAASDSAEPDNTSASADILTGVADFFFPPITAYAAEPDESISDENDSTKEKTESNTSEEDTTEEVTFDDTK